MDIEKNKVNNKVGEGGLGHKTKVKLKKTDLSISVVLLIGILIVVNFFSYSIFYRLDLTENKIYSISSATKNTVTERYDIVNIKA